MNKKERSRNNKCALKNHNKKRICIFGELGVPTKSVSSLRAKLCDEGHQGKDQNLSSKRLFVFD